MTSPSATPSRGVLALAHVGVAVVVAALSAVAVWTVFPEVLEGALAGPDSYMRLVRVERLLETGAWYDGGIPRSNAPWGEVLHWTRPLDVLLVAGAGVLEPFLGDAALHVAGVVLPTVLLIVTCFAVGWAAVPVAGERYRFVAMAAVPVQLGIVGYALPGRPDHHALILLLFAVTAGLFLRALREPRRRVWALATGVALGGGLWVGPEALVSAALVFGVGGVLWLGSSPVAGALNRRIALGFVVSVAGALLVERPPAGLAAVEYDRLSVVHLVLAGLLFLFWWGGARWAEARGRGAGSVRRAGTAAVGGATALGVLLLFFPGFLRGPTADVDPVVMEVWLQHVSEYGAFLWPRSGRDVGMLIATLGPALFCIPVALRRAGRGWETGEGPQWIFLAVGVVGFTVLALLRGRFLGYPQVLFVLVTVALLAELHARAARVGSSRLAMAARPLLSVTLIAGCFLAGVGVMAVVPSAAAPTGPGTASPVCGGAALAARLTDPAGLGARPRLVLAPRDLGPEILYRTPHSVVATPYHRNTRGILDQRAILLGRDPAASLAALDERGVELVVVCEGPVPEGSEAPTVLDRLRAGDGIPGLRRLDTGEGGAGVGFHFWVVE